MKLNSTGLGKTTLIVEVLDFVYEYVEGEGHVLRMKMRSTAPVSWQMSARLDRDDLFGGLMALVRFLVKPKNFFYVLKLLFGPGHKTGPKVGIVKKKADRSFVGG